MLRTFFKKIIPWAVAIAIFAWLFNKYPPQNIWNSLKLVNISAFVAVALSYFVIMFLIDTFSINGILKHFGHQSSFREVLPARGLTYLIMVMNYAASQAAFAVYENRKHGVPISEMLGIFGIIIVTDLIILVNLAFVTTFFVTWPFSVGSFNIGDFVRIITLCTWAGFVLNWMFWRGTFGKISFLEKLRTKSFFQVLSRAKLGDYFSVIFYRLPVHVFIMLGMYVAVRPFHLDLPFSTILSNIPLVFFIGALPISPGGIGTSNMALVELFKPHVVSPLVTGGLVTAGELLMSFSLVWMFANYVMKALTGVICLQFVSKDLFKPTKEEEKECEVAVPDAAHLGDDL